VGRSNDLAWSLVSAGIDLRREELIAFTTRLALALRVGHGMAVSGRLIFRSERGAVFTLNTEEASTARWATRVLFPAFAPSHWVPESSVPIDPGSTTRCRGRRVGAWPIPWVPSIDGGGWGDAVVRALDGLPAGVFLDWSFRPAPLPRPPWLGLSPEPPPAPGNPPDRRLPARGSTGRPTPTPILREKPVLWVVDATVGIPVDRPSSPSFERVLATFDSSLAGEGANGIRFRPGWRSTIGVASRFLVTESELAALFPSPTCRLSPPPTGPFAPFVLPLGRTPSGRVVGPAIESGQGRHLAILGETGMGKSSLLVAIALRASRAGNVVLFDPMGETARSLEEEIGPEGAPRILRLFAGESSAGMNALEGIGPGGGANWMRGERRLNDIVHALRRVRAGRYADSGFWGPRLEEMLTRSLRAAAAIPQGTLTDAHTLLATGGRTRRELPAEGVAPVRELADRIRERPEDAEGARRLLYEVVRSQLLERLLCDPEPGVHAEELVAPERITLISGDAPQVGETSARYLLAVYLALVWSELIGRQDARKTFVLLDEAQWFAHESLAEMLRLGRRGNVHVVLATQAIASLPEIVREAVWTNVADLVSFRGSPEEARELSRVARGVSMEAVLALPRGRAVVLLGKGQATHYVHTSRMPRRARGPGGSGATANAPRSAVDDRTDRPPPRISAATDTTATPRVASPEDVMVWVRGRAAALPGEAVFQVHLDELRRTLDPAGTAVRTAGRRLSQAGAIDHTGRDSRGAFWAIRSDRIPPPDGSVRSAATPGVTSPGKPS
jgi:hypothetical protein